MRAGGGEDHPAVGRSGRGVLTYGESRISVTKKRLKKTVKIRLRADPRKLRKVWKVKPQTRVVENARERKLESIRDREARGSED
jgi:hypothetical protein